MERPIHNQCVFGSKIMIRNSNKMKQNKTWFYTKWPTQTRFHTQKVNLNMDGSQNNEKLEWKSKK